MESWTERIWKVALQRPSLTMGTERETDSHDWMEWLNQADYEISAVIRKLEDSFFSSPDGNRVV